MLPLNLVIIGFVGWSLAREASRGNEFEGQLAALHAEIEELDQRNRDYVALIGKFGTSGYVEREARVKLGYQKLGERVIILREGASTEGTLESLVGKPHERTNPQKWWDHFFGAQ